MTRLVRVGLLDSGLGPGMPIRAEAAFVLTGTGVARIAAGPDVVGHGTTIGKLILAPGGYVELLSAQVFVRGATTTPAAVAAGLDWLREQGAELVSLSLGLRADRAVLRRACADAVAAGLALVAAMPARGVPVYPAAYPGVLAVSGDARCRPGEVSWLPEHGPRFGACPRPAADDLATPGPVLIGGSSFAVGHVCGLLAHALGGGDLGVPAAAADFLARRAHYYGREHRSGSVSAAEAQAASAARPCVSDPSCPGRQRDPAVPPCPL